MAKKDSNILAIGSSNEVLYEILAELKEAKDLSEQLLIESKLTNKYLQAISDECFDEGDVC